MTRRTPPSTQGTGARPRSAIPAKTPRAGLTRRDLLAAAAALAAGCSPRAPLDSSHVGIGGTIVGASHQTGHRLREGGLPEPRTTRDVGVVILGGGMAGLSAAWKLAKSGFDDFARDGFIGEIPAGPALLQPVAHRLCPFDAYARVDIGHGIRDCFMVAHGSSVLARATVSAIPCG